MTFTIFRYSNFAGFLLKNQDYTRPESKSTVIRKQLIIIHSTC